MTKNIAEKMAKRICKSNDIDIFSFFKAFNIPINKNLLAKGKVGITTHINSVENFKFTSLKASLYPEEISRKQVLWDNGYYEVYISNLSNDFVRAISLKKNLRNYGISAYISRVNSSFENSENNLEALMTCKSFLALNNKDYHRSYKTSQEIGFAIGKGLEIFSIKKKGKNIGFLDKTIKIKSSNTEKIAENLFQNLVGNLKFRDDLIDSLIIKFEKSSSFQTARNNFTFLQKNKYWQKSHLDRLLKASKQNGQIGSCTICLNGDFQRFIDSQIELL